MVDEPHEHKTAKDTLHWAQHTRVLKLLHFIAAILLKFESVIKTKPKVKKFQSGVLLNESMKSYHNKTHELEHRIKAQAP